MNNPSETPDTTDVPVSSSQHWNNEYLNGDWDYLSDRSEFARYALISSYCQKLKPRGAILDAGCGEGLLYSHLQAPVYYHGIDISDAAIDKACNKYGNYFSCRDINDFKSEIKFDVLVLNEVLYYLNPEKVLQQLSLSLNQDALVVISVYQLNTAINGISCRERETALIKILNKYVDLDFAATLDVQTMHNGSQARDREQKTWKIYFATQSSPMSKANNGN